MSRPKKWRNVGSLPESRGYGPLDSDIDATETSRMTVEEYETVRLVNLLGLTQEECSERMGVSRTTVQDIHSKAIQKMASSLVEGIPLIIKGGRYRICEHSENCCRRACKRDSKNITVEIDKK